VALSVAGSRMQHCRGVPALTDERRSASDEKISMVSLRLTQ
jgi:hypothetical protein